MRKKWYYVENAKFVLIGNDKDIRVYTLDEVKEKFPKIFNKIVIEGLK